MEGHSVSGESRKNGWVEQKKELTKVLKIAWPAVFESFFISLAGMIDVYMVSGLGSEAVASVGLTTQPKFLGLSLFFAMNVAIAAIVARRTGEKDKRRANETLAEAILLTILFGAVITVACVSLAGWLMEKCGSAPDTHDGAVIYFQIIMGGMIFNIISMVINAAQRGAGNTKIAMYTNTISSIVNIIGNYLLIGGHLGFPKLGIRGAALATVLGTVVGCTISVMSLFRKDSFLSIPYIIKEGLWKRFESVKIILKLSSSTFVEQILMRIGFMSTAVMAADMGTAAMAAHQVGMNALSLSFSFGDGMQAAAVALIGQSLGSKEPQEAKRHGMTCEKVALVMAVFMSMFYLFCGKWLFGLFFAKRTITRIEGGRCENQPDSDSDRTVPDLSGGIHRSTARCGRCGVHHDQFYHQRYLCENGCFVYMLLYCWLGNLRNLDGYRSGSVLSSDAKRHTVPERKMDENQDLTYL